MLKKSISLLLVGGFLLIPPSTSLHAESLSEKKQNLQKQAESQKQKIDEASKKLDDVSDKMRALQNDWQEATDQYNKVQSDLDDANNKMEQLEEQLKENQAKLDKHIGYLQRRVRDIYIHGQISYIDVLFGAQDFTDFLNRVNIIKRILTYDYNLIHDIKTEHANIEKNKNEQAATKAKIEDLYKDASAKKSTLDEKKAALQDMEDKLKNDKETAEKAYAEIQAASQRIQEMIEAREAAGTQSGVVGTGQMIWPIHGPITSPFGYRIHPIYHYRIFHSGIDIGGDYGDPIHAADSGTVIYSGWVSGYGNTVMIDHGNGLISLYGHNQSLAVSVGQSVRQGQVISYCGSTGNSTGPHCHFEVRKNGRPVNPLNYL